jgi:hypothetical protein
VSRVSSVLLLRENLLSGVGFSSSGIIRVQAITHKEVEMKKAIWWFALLALFAVISTPAFASEEKISQADELYESGGLDNYKQAMEIYVAVTEAEPDNFEAHWKAARAIREYAEEQKRLGTANFEEINAEYGKRGMAYAERAIALEPGEPGGYLLYGMSVGTYSNGVGIFRALREGLKDKTQSNLERAYEIDPLFLEGAPIVAIGRFWQLVPWPFRDTDKAEKFYREFQETEYYAGNVESRIYLAELLQGKRGHGNEAKALLEEALQMDAHPYWHKEARALLAKL